MNAPSLKTMFRAITAAVLIGCTVALAAAGLFIARALTRSVAAPQETADTEVATTTLHLDDIKDLLAASQARRSRPQPSTIANPFVRQSPQQLPTP